MSTNLHKNLPVGVQDFESLIRDGYLYVDKTEQIWRLTHSGRHYFLARPRRFGKSLLLSTIEAYFEGKKELFDGLYIQQQEHDWLNYPIFLIGLNFSSKTRRLEEWKIGQRNRSEKSVRGIGQKVEIVFTLIKANPTITRDELSEKLGMAPSSIQRYIDVLKIDRIRRVGGDFGGHWEIINKD